MYTIYLSPVTKQARKRYGNFLSENPVGIATCKQELRVKLKRLAKLHQVRVDDFEFFETIYVPID